MNEIIRVITIDGITNFILKTENEDGFWLWQVDNADILHYFGLNPDYVGTISTDDFNRFVNDIENATIGTSSGTFETIADARKEIYNSYK